MHRRAGPAGSGGDSHGGPGPGGGGSGPAGPSPSPGAPTRWTWPPRAPLPAGICWRLEQGRRDGGQVLAEARVCVWSGGPRPCACVRSVARVCHRVAVRAPGWRGERVRLPGGPFPAAAPRQKLQTRGSRPARAQLPAAQAVSSSSFTAGPGDSACNYTRPRRRCQLGAEVPRGRSPGRGGPGWGRWRQASEGRGRQEARPAPRTVNISERSRVSASRPAPRSRLRPRPRGAPGPAVADVRRAAPAGPKSSRPPPLGGASRALGSPGRTPGCGLPTCPWRGHPIPARVSGDRRSASAGSVSPRRRLPGTWRTW